MSLLRYAVWVFAGVGLVFGVGSALSQNYPTKPLRIVTGGTGGSNDLAARVIAQGLTSSLGQPVIVENRSSGVVPAETVAKAPPDAYTLLVAGNSHWITPLLQNVSYDPVKDFSPISLTVRAPNVVVVNPSVAARSIKELIAVAKARPGELNYVTSGTGFTNHLAGELFIAMTGINIVRINYKSPAAALNDLVSAQAHLMFGSAPATAPHVKSGRLRALAVTSAQPTAVVPGLPTVAASGVPGYSVETLNGIYAPGRTATTLISRLNREIVRGLAGSDVKEKLFNGGLEVVGSSPEAFAATIKTEMTTWSKVIKDTGMRAE